MSVVENVKKIMNGKTISGKMDNTKMIINAIVSNEASESVIMSFITKQKMSEQSIIAAATQESKVLNRKKVSFDSFNEYNEYKKTHELGNSWDEDGKVCAYQY